MLLVFGACAGTLRPVQVHRMKIRRHLIRALSANRQKSAFCRSRTAGLFKPRGSRLSRAFLYPLSKHDAGSNSFGWIFCAEKGPGRRPAIRPFSLEQNASPSGHLNSADISKGSNIPRTPPIVNRGSSGTPPALKFGKTTRLQPE